MQQDGDNRVRVCAIIPAYNEAETITEVIQQTRKYVDKVFVVDDGSTDNTAEVARRNGAKIIQHLVRRGPGAALQSGYDIAISNGFNYVLQIDGDGQHNPRHIPKMLELARRCDMVIASRFLNKSYQSYPFVRRLGISFFTFVVNLLANAGITDVTSGYRIYRTESLKRLGPVPNGHWAVEQTLEAAKKGFRIKEISAEMRLRSTGKSQFSLKQYAFYSFRMVWAIIKAMLFK